MNDRHPDSFPGERPEHHMKKTRVDSPRVTCGSCRKFDGTAWCRHWNFHSTAESPTCRFYARKPGAKTAASSARAWSWTAAGAACVRMTETSTIRDAATQIAA